MSLTSILEKYKDSTRLVLNDKYIGDNGVQQLSQFISTHRRLQSLEIKSNDITSNGFNKLFDALSYNTNLKHLVLEYNCLGQNTYSRWQDSFQQMMKQCTKLERLNLSNNKISDQDFARMAKAIANSKGLKLLEIKHNNIQTKSIDKLIQFIKSTKNQVILYVDHVGNKIKKQTIDNLQKLLKINRQKNPISKDKLLIPPNSNPSDRSALNSKNHPLEDKTLNNLSKQNIIRQLEDILDQNRKDTTQAKIRLEQQLQQLQKRQKNDAKDLHQLDNKCNQLLMANRNLKFQVDRTNSEHQQIQRDQQYHIRIHQEKIRQANKQLLDLQTKYNQIQNRMNKQHELKMKQIARDWENRLRAIQQKIRMTQNQNNAIDNQIKKQMEKKQRLRVQYLDEENIIRLKVEDQESQKYELKINTLQAKIIEIRQSRQQFIRRNQQLLYEIQKTQINNQKNIEDLQVENQELKRKEDQFTRKNKDFIARNQKLKSDMQLRTITIQKLQQQINRLNQQIQTKKAYNREQVSQVVDDSKYNRAKNQQQKQILINKLNQLQANLRTFQLQNSKLRQQYAILAQRLQIGLGKAVQDVFTENSLY